MALNKKILSKLAEKTSEDQDLQAFLADIFQYESVARGWYERKYSEFLEMYCNEEVEP